MLDFESWTSLGLEGGGVVAGKTYTDAQCYAHAVKLNPEYVPAWESLASAGGGYIQGKQYTKAQCCQQVLDIQSRRTTSVTCLGSAGKGSLSEWLQSCCTVVHRPPMLGKGK